MTLPWLAAWLPEASALQQLDGHPAWEPAQKDGRRKAFMALLAEGRNVFLPKWLLLD